MPYDWFSPSTEGEGLPRKFVEIVRALTIKSIDIRSENFLQFQNETSF